MNVLDWHQPGLRHDSFLKQEKILRKEISLGISNEISANKAISRHDEAGTGDHSSFLNLDEYKINSF